MRRLNQPTAVNVLTSSCNPIPYRDNLFGPDFATSLFLCEPANNLVHREVLTPDGVSFSSRRAVSEASSEFLASEDNWSRFTQARTGPDGCLYVVDMYRLIIEHPEWIPPQMLGSLDLFAGHDKGRIYRIRPQGSTPRKIPDLSKLTDGELGLALQSPNGWTRDNAQRLLLERGSKWAVTQPVGSPATQVQQLWTMHTLGTLTAATLQAAHLSPHATVREHAVRLCEDRLSEGPLLDAVLKAAEDADLRVRYQAALTLGATQDPRRDAVFSELGKKASGQAPMFIALLTAAPGHAEAKAWQAALKVTNSPSFKSAAPIITGTVNPERAKVVARYAGVATLTGNSANGHALYLANCAACHKLKGEGNEIGPDLGTIAGKPTEQLLEAIFDPSRAVEQRYLLQTITLKDGRTLAGLVSEQNANAITLKLGAVTEVILREQVAKIETSNKSLMPDGLEAILNPQQTADLLAWVRQK
jgi:putative heme-binding domain-containing protein